MARNRSKKGGNQEYSIAEKRAYWQASGIALEQKKAGRKQFEKASPAVKTSAANGYNNTIAKLNGDKPAAGSSKKVNNAPKIDNSDFVILNGVRYYAEAEKKTQS